VHPKHGLLLLPHTVPQPLLLPGIAQPALQPGIAQPALQPSRSSHTQKS
jgi:hypothetical protein